MTLFDQPIKVYTKEEIIAQRVRVSMKKDLYDPKQISKLSSFRETFRVRSREEWTPS